MKYGQKVFEFDQPGSVYKPKSRLVALFWYQKSNIDTRSFTSLVVCACIAVNPLLQVLQIKCFYIN
jgi:hypothetical protein